MQSPDRLLACVLVAGAALLAACAEGSTIEPSGGTSGGDGGSSGDGGRSGDGGSGDGGSPTGAVVTGSGTPSSSATGLSSSSSSTSGAGSSTSASSTSASSTSASSTSAVGSTAASSTAAATSSTGGGGGDCQPLDPAPVCGGGQHCVPAPAGEEPLCTPAGGGGFYAACFDNAECGPTTECVDVGDFFANPCCLQYCRDAADCETPEGSLGTCYFANTPIYANGVEYGICYDDAGGCF